MSIFNGLLPFAICVLGPSRSVPRPESEDDAKGSSETARLGEDVEEGEGGMEVERGRLRVGSEGFDMVAMQRRETMVASRGLKNGKRKWKGDCSSIQRARLVLGLENINMAFGTGQTTKRGVRFDNGKNGKS